MLTQRFRNPWMRFALFSGQNLPVLRHIPQPLNSGGLEPDTGIQAPGDGLVDQCLPLILQQGDEPLLARDVPPDLLVGVVEEPDDGGLFPWGRNGEPEVFQLPAVNVMDREAPSHDRFLNSHGLTVEYIAAVSWVEVCVRAEEYDVSPTVSRAVDQVHCRLANFFCRLP